MDTLEIIIGYTISIKAALDNVLKQVLQKAIFRQGLTFSVWVDGAEKVFKFIRGNTEKQRYYINTVYNICDCVSLCKKCPYPFMCLNS